MTTNQRLTIFLFCLCLNPPQISSSVCGTTQSISSGDIFQIVFLFDRNQPGLKDGLKQAVSNTMVYLETNFKGSEIAIVSHGKFSSTTDDTTCYGHLSEFDTSDTYMLNQVDKATTINDATGYFSPLSAVCLAAQDESLGWHRGKTDGMGKTVRRLIVFYAVQDNYFGTNSPADFLEYGFVNQGCSNLKPLDHRSIRGILRDKDVAVLGLYEGKELKEFYDLHFMSFSVPYCSVDFGDFSARLYAGITACAQEIVKIPVV